MGRREKREGTERQPQKEKYRSENNRGGELDKWIIAKGTIKSAVEFRLCEKEKGRRIRQPASATELKKRTKAKQGTV